MGELTTVDWRHNQSLWLLALVGIVCVYNVPQLVEGSVQFDAVEVHYSAQRYLSEELHAGRLPFWTPYLFSGFPFLADLQVAAWYPLNWPFLLAGITPRSIGLELLLHSLIATLGAYAFTLHLLQRPAAAAIAAMFYGLSGWFAAHSQHVGMFDTAAWLPWLLVVLLHLADRVTPRRLASAGVLGAAIILSGHFQLALYTFAFLGVWAILEAAAQKSWRLARHLIFGLAVSGLWGGALSAIMLLPAWELVGQSVRAQFSATNLPDVGYFHLGSLLTLVDPDYYGLLSGRYVGPGDSTQHYFYAGILLLPLALMGLRHRQIVRMAVFLGIPFLWYASGPVGGLYCVLARLPGFSSVELPMHGWFLPALGLALLGGAGAAMLEQRVHQRWLAVVAGLVLVDVLTVNQLLNPLAYARASFDELYEPPLRALAAQVAAASEPVRRLYGPPLAEVGYRNHALQSRIETTYGYNPLELSGYADYAAAAETNPRLVAGFGATHDLTPDGGVRADPHALPLAYFASEVLAVPEDASAQQALLTLDPAQTTIVTGAALDVTADATASVTVQTRSEDELTLHYTSRTPNVVRVAIPMYPGWSATLDGREVSLVRVDRAFIGVVVPPGQGDIQLAYTPRLFWVGAALSALASVLVLVALCTRPSPSSVSLGHG